MGLEAKSLKKMNCDMAEPVFVKLPGFDLSIFSSRGTKAKGQKNEDSCGFSSPTPSQIALVVSDGLGGHSHGDKASKLAVSTVLGRSTSGKPFRSGQMIAKIEKAHQKIVDLKASAGATLVAAVIEGKKLWLYSVGDSLGLHLSKGGEVLYKTFEHSVTGFATEAGLMSESEAQEHEQSHVILNSLGFNDSRIESSLVRPVGSKDKIFLCSDGLTEHMQIDEICQSLKKGSIEKAAQDIFTKCEDLRKKAEVFDDLTFLICEVTQQ